jgi:predicted DCC family thiol-disulfide oxidoreductase YuxK
MGAKIEPPAILFDGDCGICTYLAGWARRRDRKRQFTIEPFQSFEEQELRRFGLSYHSCSRKLQVLTSSGKTHSGAHGVNYFFLKQFPWSILIVILYIVPVLLVLEILGYALVAKYRTRISRFFGLEGCLVKVR